MYNRCKNNAPCYGCTDRVVNETVNCHNECERYNAWKKELHEAKSGLRKQLDPSGCGYFKQNRTSGIAPMSKRRYY